MFEVGEIIVCTDKEVNYTGNDGSMKGITIGKKYEVKSIKNRGNYIIVHIMNDYNISGNYYEYRFISLSDYRRKKLLNIQSNMDSLYLKELSEEMSASCRNIEYLLIMERRKQKLEKICSKLEI